MAFLGIKIPLTTGRLLSQIDVPGTKEGNSEYHITLLHLGDDWPISEVSHALEATYEIVSKIKPFKASVKEITSFPNTPAPIIAKVESKELHKIRKQLAYKFDDCKIEYSKLHKDFKPHITLSYADEKIDAFKIDEVEFMIEEIVLWCGDIGNDRLFVTFPLQGPEKQKQSLLLQRADIFYKMAKNSDQKYFMQSIDRRKVER